MKKYYYELQYFFSRYESGSIGVATREKLDTDNVDECILYLDSRYLIDDYYTSNIISIKEISKEEYIDRYSEEDENEYNDIQLDRINVIHDAANAFINALLYKPVKLNNADSKIVQSLIDRTIEELRLNGYTPYYPDPLEDE